MRLFPVPVEIEFEPKVIGGRLTARQGLWLVLGMGLWGMTYLLLGGGGILVGGVLCAVCAALGIAPVPRAGTTLDRYVLLRVRYALGPKAYPYRGNARG